MVHPNQRIRGVTPLPRLEIFCYSTLLTQCYFLSGFLYNILPTTSASKIPLKIPTKTLNLNVYQSSRYFIPSSPSYVDIRPPPPIIFHTMSHYCQCDQTECRMRHSKGILSNHDGTASENVALLVLLSDYSSSFNLSSPRMLPLIRDFYALSAGQCG